MAIERLSQASILTLNKYASMNAGASSDYELIATVILGASQPTITFSQTATWANFKHLQIRGASRTDVASVYVDTRMKLNGDAGANYSVHEIYGAGTATPASGGAASQSVASCCYSAGSSAAASIYSALIVDILDPFSTTKNKTIRGFSGVVASSNLADLRSSAWYSLNAVTSIELNLASGNFVSGTRFSLYGIRG